MYNALLLDHFKHSPYKGIINNPTVITQEYNPSCGDAVRFFFQIENNTIDKIMFMGDGCVISQATASLLCGYLMGKSLHVIMDLDAEILLQIIQVPLGPVRLQCALLSLYALKKAYKELHAQ